MFRVVLLLFTALLSLNSWSQSAKRSPTLNYMPVGSCSIKTKPLYLPNTDTRIRFVEAFTIRRGTGCKVGEAHSFWKKCDIRDNETEAGSEPETSVNLKFRNDKSGRNDSLIMFSMTKAPERQATFDRLGNPIGLYETTTRENVEIDDQIVNVVVKRQIPKLSDSKIVTEIQVFSVANKETKTKSKLLVKGKCESEIKNY